MKTSRKILIVEDDPLLAENISLTLEKEEGIELCGVAPNLKSAVDIMKRNPADLALIDVQLEGPEDGIATANELLKIKWIPIIYMTGNTPLEMKEKMKNTFPAAFLEKPLRMRELYVQIDLALHNFQSNNFVPSDPIQQDQLFLPTSQGFAGIKTREILFIKADRIRSEIFVTEREFYRIYPGKKYTAIHVSVNMGSVFRQLTSQFFLLSRSIVINLSHISRIDTSRLFIENHEIPIPDGRRKDLVNRLKVVKG
ncbi:response regulator transcription factor [Dyadobacter sp. CY323]|uniref:response regulator transcription factor n=1 Tax=Dyadobacter sp. CY323 TaxID=2907302 RepID=UPI001F31B4EC|nr:response regulator [Dyadobacter sp. CY323]MCE6992714.1 response regulator [Dyadobacter sp. CY323]